MAKAARINYVERNIEHFIDELRRIEYNRNKYGTSKRRHKQFMMNEEYTKKIAKRACEPFSMTDMAKIEEGAHDGLKATIGEMLKQKEKTDG